MPLAAPPPETVRPTLEQNRPLSVPSSAELGLAGQHSLSPLGGSPASSNQLRPETNMDGNGDLGLVSANTSSNDLRVLYQTHPGRFDPTPRIVGGPGTLDWPVAVIAEDLDGDWDVDLATASRESNTLTIFFRDHQ